MENPMSQTTTAKKPTKQQQTQAEREKSLIAQGYVKGLEIGRCEGHSSGYSDGYNNGHNAGYALASARCSNYYRSFGFWFRLRYLINSQHMN